MAKTMNVAPRSLQEWMERTGINGVQLCDIVRRETGRTISPTMMSFILRGGRRCSLVNARALHQVTGVPTRTLRKWPPVSARDKVLVGRSSDAA